MTRFYTWLSGKLKGGMGKNFLMAMLPLLLASILLVGTAWRRNPFRWVEMMGIVLAKPLNEPRENPSTLRMVWYLILFMLYLLCIAFILWQAAFVYKIW